MTEFNAQISSSIDNLTREFETVAHNMANVGTAGYKRHCNQFSKILDQMQQGQPVQDPDAPKAHEFIDFTQGNVVQTGRNLDFAISGKGFFVLETQEGKLYTRHGIFQVNNNGQIVDSSGRTVAGDAGPITIPTTVSQIDLHVSDDGSISANGAMIGKFSIVNFPEDESKLTPAGYNCFSAPKKANVQPATDFVVKQGFTESSNVKIIEELVDMITVSRLYESAMKMIASKKDTGSSLLDVARG